MKKVDIFEYFEDSADIPKAAKDIYLGILPKGISNVEQLLRALSTTLLFPSYFGFNWHALSDCLRDFHWLNEKTILLVHQELPQLSRDDLWEYLDVLKECIHDWSANEDHMLRVMFPEACGRQITDTLE